MSPSQRPRPTSADRAETSKRAQTRRHVLRAAFDCIAENGIAGATASEIARRCDLSWGVIQYHFGDRLGLFLALLEDGASNLVTALTPLDSESGDLEERVAALVDGTWALMRRDDYRVSLEVQLQLGRDASHRARVRKVTRQLRTQVEEVWQKSLPECDQERTTAAERLATMALRGFALEHMLDGGRSSYTEERAAIVDFVLTALDQPEA